MITQKYFFKIELNTQNSKNILTNVSLSKMRQMPPTFSVICRFQWLKAFKMFGGFFLNSDLLQYEALTGRTLFKILNFIKEIAMYMQFQLIL